MKHRQMLLYAMVIGLLCAMPIGAAAVTTEPPVDLFDGAWLPNPDCCGALVIELDSDIRPGKSLSLYDYKDHGDQLFLFNDGYYANVTITFTPIDEELGGGWAAMIGDGGDQIDASLFGFVFNNNGESFFEYELIDTGAGAFIMLESNTGLEVLVNCMNPVPIPPAILLLGSGLVGMVALRRRK